MTVQSEHVSDEPWNRDLTGPALRIASSESKRLLVEAGPGTGKTFALQRRVLRLLTTGRINASGILAVTFTRTAANDLRKKLNEQTSGAGDKISATTLHSFCFDLLNIEQVFKFSQRTPRPLITASKSSLLGFEATPLLSDVDHPLYSRGTYRTNTLKCKGIRALEAAWARLQSEAPGFPSAPDERQLYKDIVDWLRFHKAILIGELVPLALNYLKHNPQAPETGKYAHILVDEYQDLTKAEQVLIDLITGSNDCMVVGDVDQSIFSFRYAQPGGLKDYAIRHPNAERTSLEECRRCPSNVVSLASELIEKNHATVGETLKPHPQREIGNVAHRQWLGLDDQIAGTLEYVRWVIRTKHVSEGEVLVLSPSRKIGYAIKKGLRESGIEACSYFHEEALEEEETKRQFTLLSLLAHPNDRVSLRWWLGQGSNTHNRREYKKLREYCEQNDVEPVVALKAWKENGRAGVDNLIERYDELQSQLSRLGKRGGQELLDALFPPDEDWAQDIRVLAGQPQGTTTAKALYETLLDQITQPGMPTEVSHVRIMSLHKAKGLTARAVAVVGCVDRLIPREYNSEKSTVSEAEHFREQRRLFYVALTRTTEYLLISSFRKVPISQGFSMGMNQGVQQGGFFTYTASQFLGELGPGLPVATTDMAFD